MIQNTPTKYLDDKEVKTLRAAFEHRAQWFYLLCEQLEKHGIDLDEAGREAIFKCGVMHGNTKYPQGDDLLAFCDAFLPEAIQKVLEVEMEKSEDEVKLDFHYCPLVAAWQKMTDDEKKIQHLCDIAMDGDRGVLSTHPGFKFELTDTITTGCPTCKIRISKVK